MSLSFSLPSLLGEQVLVARRVGIPTARGVPRTAAASETCARARPRVRPGRGSVPAQGLQTLKVTVDVYGKRKWAAGGGGPGDLFN
ncbi:hypothetical protein PVAP13_4NG298300 [Panicum virgatum]|uniref:Uncharacterized protein n=1 Tax=Panicum virgatum TaxID=38727 RepID=A0A8T0TGB7_PANVG|nr:hypothetical protein PVAP13_4NG298300 [Panicum virgatum]